MATYLFVMFVANIVTPVWHCIANVVVDVVALENHQNVGLLA